MSELYELPDGWEWKSLDDFTTIKSGKRVPKGYKLSEELTQYPYIRVTDFNNHSSVDTDDIKYISEEIYQKIKNYTITDKDIYISVAGTIGKTGIIPSELNGANLTENAVKIVFDNELYDKRFLLNFTNSIVFMEQVGLATKAVAMPKLAITRLKKVLIPLPPLKEQKRIVSKLDTIFAKIDKSIALHQKNMDEADVFMGSVLNGVFGELEEKYDLKTIKSFSKVGTGVTPLKSKTQYYENGNINWITSKATNFDFVNDCEQLVTSTAINECRLKIYPIGTIIVALYGQGKTRGQVSELMIETATNQAIATIVVDNNQAINRYLKCFLKKSYLDLRRKASGGTQANLNLTIIKNIELPLPALSIQQKTVAYLDEISQKIEKIKSVQKEKMKSLVALKASILDQAFRGEL